MTEEFGYISNIGMLYINEIYYYYDEPQLFLCANNSSQKYLALLTDMDIVKRKWLLIAISENRIIQMKQNKITLRELFTSPELDFAWYVIPNDDELSCHVQFPRNIPDEDLPTENEYLDLLDEDVSDEFTKPDNNIIEAAKSELRDILDISLEENNAHENEIDCSVLSKVLKDTQEMTYSLAESLDKQREKKSKEFFRERVLRIATFQPASFGIRLKSNNYCDLLSETPITPVLKAFAELLESTKSKGKLKECLNNHSKKTIIRYRGLIKTLVSANTAINIKGASPSDFSFETKFSTNELTGYLDILNKEIENIQEEKEYIGSPVAINIDKRFFSFKKIDNEYINGTVSEAFDVRSFLTHTTAKIRVIENIDINTITDEERRKYHLISLEAIND